MKKNAMMKIAAILMVAVLLTTCAISSTFAKYTTSDNASTAARIAKFGVALDTTFTSDFGTSYATDDGTYTSTIANSVVAADDPATKLIAPGTTGTLTFDSKVTGTAEVAVKVATDVEITLGSAFTETYCPVYFKVGDTTYKHKSIDSTSTYATIADLLTAVESALEAGANTSVAANESLATVLAAKSVVWAWDFETGADTATKTTNNEKDTAIGKAADNSAAISITVAQSVEQID